MPHIVQQDGHPFHIYFYLFLSSMIPFTPHHDTFPFPFNFVSVKASNSKYLSLKTSTPSSLFAVPFTYLTFHVPNRFTKFRRVIQGRSRRRFQPLTPLYEARWYTHKERRNRLRLPSPAPQTIYSRLLWPAWTIRWTYSVHGSQGIGEKEQRKSKFTMSIMLWDSWDMWEGSRRSSPGVCEGKKSTYKSARTT